MKILCLLDSAVKPGDRWIWDCIPGNQDKIDFLSTQSADRYKKWGKLLTYYPAYWDLAVRAYRQTLRNEYDVVVAWEGKNGFPYAVLRRLFGQSQPPLVILCFTYRGLVRSIQPIARSVLKSVNHLTVTTQFELEEYRKRLAIPPDRISLLLLGWYDGMRVVPANIPVPGEPFILAAGRSFRDYATLAKAVEGLRVRVIIVARKFNLGGIPFPPNVETRDLIPSRNFWQLLRQASFLVVPVEPVPHSSGDILIVQAMSVGKAVVATSTASPLTYVDDGVTGLLAPPRDAAAMRQKIQYLLAHPGEVERMGKAARQRYERLYTFEDMARKIDEILREIGGAHEE